MPNTGSKGFDFKGFATKTGLSRIQDNANDISQIICEFEESIYLQRLKANLGFLIQK